MNTVTRSDFQKVLEGYRLVTAEILYHLPDHERLLQQFIWQGLDLIPHLPVLKKFLTFWETSLDGKLHAVRVAHSGLVVPTELKYYGKDRVITIQ